MARIDFIYCFCKYPDTKLVYLDTALDHIGLKDNLGLKLNILLHTVKLGFLCDRDVFNHSCLLELKFEVSGRLFSAS